MIIPPIEPNATLQRSAQALRETSDRLEQDAEELNQAVVLQLSGKPAEPDGPSIEHALLDSNRMKHTYAAQSAVIRASQSQTNDLFDILYPEPKK